MHTLVPDIVVHPQAYVMIGMATLLAGVAKVPLSTTIMISEITGSYRLLVPLIFAGVVVHLLVSRRGLFTQQVGGHADSPAHRHDLLPDLLASLRVRHVVKPVPYFHVLEPGNTLAEILDVFTRTQVVVLDEVQSLLASTQAMQHLIVAHDIQSPFAFVPADGTLEDARAAFERTGYPELPVVDQGQITGFIRKAQLVSEYHRAYLRTRSAFEPEQ
jgi:CIC family chloride channel protein